MSDANVRAAMTAGGISMAAREAHRSSGDYGYLVRNATGEWLRAATYEEHERSCDAAVRQLDPGATIEVPPYGACRVEEL